MDAIVPSSLTSPTKQSGPALQTGASGPFLPFAMLGNATAERLKSGRLTPLNNLAHRIPFEILTVTDMGDLDLLASKLGKKASKNSGASIELEMPFRNRGRDLPPQLVQDLSSQSLLNKTLPSRPTQKAK